MSHAIVCTSLLDEFSIIDFLVLSNCSLFLELIITHQLFLLNSFAVAAPMPVEPPVIQIVFKKQSTHWLLKLETQLV